MPAGGRGRGIMKRRVSTTIRIVNIGGVRFLVQLDKGVLTRQVPGVLAAPNAYSSAEGRVCV